MGETKTTRILSETESLAYSTGIDRGRAENRERVAELEAIVRSQNVMLNEIATAAGFRLGDTYSTQALISRLSTPNR